MHVDMGKPFPAEREGALTKVVESLKIGPSVLTGLGWGWSGGGGTGRRPDGNSLLKQTSGETVASLGT